MARPKDLTGQGDQLRKDLATLGKLWNLDRPLRGAELGRALRMGPSNEGQSVYGWLAGTRWMGGPASVAIEMMLLGALPPDGLSAVIADRTRGEK